MSFLFPFAKRCIVCFSLIIPPRRPGDACPCFSPLSYLSVVGLLVRLGFDVQHTARFAHAASLVFFFYGVCVCVWLTGRAVGRLSLRKCTYGFGYGGVSLPFWTEGFVRTYGNGKLWGRRVRQSRVLSGLNGRVFDRYGKRVEVVDV